MPFVAVMCFVPMRILCRLNTLKPDLKKKVMLSPSPFKKVKNCHVTLTSVPVNVESWQTLPYNVLNKSFGKQVEIQILVYLFVYFKT